MIEFYNTSNQERADSLARRTSQIFKKHHFEIKLESANKHSVKRLEADIWRANSSWRLNDNQALKIWMKIFDSKRLLKELTIQHSGVIIRTDVELGYISEAIKRFDILQKLDLVFSANSFITNDGIRSLCEGLKKCNSLQTLHLHFKHSCPSLSFSELTFYRIQKSLKRMASLKDISIGFPSNMQRTKEGIPDLMKAVSRLKLLQRLSLGFPNCRNLTEKNLKDLSQSLKKLVQLQNLSLDFSGCNGVSDVFLYYLGQGLKTLPSLQTIKFDFYRFQSMSSLGILNFCEGLKTMSLLKSFALSLNEYGIDDIGLGVLGSCFENMALLENLELSFESCPHILDSGLFEFGDRLKRLNSLRKISLKFCCCSRITEDGMKYIEESLRELALLETKNICGA